MTANSYKRAADSSRQLAAEFIGKPEGSILLGIAEAYDTLSSGSATAREWSGINENAQEQTSRYQIFARR